MACFIVPAAGAVVTKVVEKVVEKNEVKTEAADSTSESFHVPFSRKLNWLFNMLMGGAFLLMFEHIWHGEVQPFFPFLTNMSNETLKYEMFHEMATTGVCMLVLVTVVWAAICIVTSVMEKRTDSVAEVE